jgi:hypothetical protein
MGGVPFSDEYNLLTHTIELWAAVITKKRRCKCSMSKLWRLSKKTNIPNPLQASLEEAQINLTSAKRKYWDFKKTARQSRDTFLEQKATAISKESGQDTAMIIKQLISREQQRECSRRIKYTLGKIRGGGITRVEVVSNDGTIQEITTKVGIEHECMNENIRKFRQTQQTPCMREPLRSALGRFGDTASGRAI